MIRICFVCLGNICRSPTAECVFRHLVTEAGLSEHFEIDSAGTSNYHPGEEPDPRTRSAGQRRGVVIYGKARQVKHQDFTKFDFLLAMDGDNLEALRQRAPRDSTAKLQLLRDFEAGAPADASVPDPYFGGEAGFDEVFAICERACAGLLEQLRATRL
jgi:protein-tyrosine phosphatase